mgnify:CR=1 FL=1
MTKVMADMHVCMSKTNMHVCMFRSAWGLTRLARRARGGLFALRVTRRGNCRRGGLEGCQIWNEGVCRRPTINLKKCQVGPHMAPWTPKIKPKRPSWTPEMLRGAQEAPRKPTMEPQGRQIGSKRRPRCAKLRLRGIKMGPDGAKMVPKKG